MLAITNFAINELNFWDLQFLFTIPARWLLYGGNSPNPTLFTGRTWGETELSCRATFSTFSPSFAPEIGRLSICESDTRFSFGKKWQRGFIHCTSKTCTMVSNSSCELRCLCNMMIKWSSQLTSNFWKETSSVPNNWKWQHYSRI